MSIAREILDKIDEGQATLHKGNDREYKNSHIIKAKDEAHAKQIAKDIKHITSKDTHD